jgi:hypothetical protein
MEGAILLSRALIDSEVFASEKLLKIWIWLLVKANFKERNIPIKIGAGQSVVTIKRGQLLFGRLSAENELFIDGSTIYKCIKKLEAIGNISIESNSHYSVITICNYDYYQDFNTYAVTAKEQPRNNQVTAEEQPSNTPNKENNDKKVKKVNNNTAGFSLFWEAYPKKVGKIDAERSWNKSKDKPEIEVILKSIEDHKRSEQWTKENGQYIPNPSTFINQGRWMDEIQNNQDALASQWELIK